jgi:hypothetical protein
MHSSELLDKGMYAEAVYQLQTECEQDAEEGTLTSLAIGYLGLGKPAESLGIFQQLIEIHNTTYEHHFIYAGVACWMLQDFRGACDYWNQGSSCGYRDMSGGVGVGLLQYFSGILLNDTLITTRAIDLIQKRLKKAWALNWPGPLGRYVIGEQSEVDVRALATAPTLHELIKRERLCRLDFYVGVHELRAGNTQLYRSHLQKCCVPNEVKFVPESFLAQFELLQPLKTKDHR